MSLLFDEKEEERVSVSDIKKEKSTKSFSGRFYIKDIVVKKGKAGPFMSFTIMDRTGMLSASFFGGNINGTEVVREKIEEDTLSEGIYDVELKTHEGRSNVVVESLKRVKGNPEEFIIIPRAVYPSVENVREKIDRLASEHLKTPEARKLYGLFWKKYGKEFARAKGGVRRHHSSDGGLLLHTYMTMRIALFLGDLYGLDLEVLLLTSLLHDIGKIDEIGDNSFTREGDLLGHTVLSLLKAEELCREAGYTGKRKANLLHCIAAHHGELEFGAPVSPKTMEAFVLHIADLADSKIYQYFEAIKGIGEGEESSEYFKDLARKIYLLDEE